jgi:periplasmic divalent cation tolerance protein
MREENRHEIEVHVAGICLRENNNSIEVLIAKRSDDRNIYPGYWECGGGQIKPGESFKDAVVRQHKEELNIISKAMIPVGTYEINVLDLPQKLIPGVYFLCEVILDDPKVDNREFVECKWIKIDEVNDYKVIPGLDKQIIKCLELYQKLSIVYVPCKNEDEAKKISRSLMDNNLAPCTNIVPISSIYNWKGKAIENSEVVVLIKTIKDKLPLIEEQVKKLHSYEVPCILHFNADANEEYVDWIKDEVNIL